MNNLQIKNVFSSLLYLQRDKFLLLDQVLLLFQSKSSKHLQILTGSIHTPTTWNIVVWLFITNKCQMGWHRLGMTDVSFHWINSVDKEVTVWFVHLSWGSASNYSSREGQPQITRLVRVSLKLLISWGSASSYSSREGQPQITFSWGSASNYLLLRVSLKLLVSWGSAANYLSLEGQPQITCLLRVSLKLLVSWGSASNYSCPISHRLLFISRQSFQSLRYQSGFIFFRLTFMIFELNKISLKSWSICFNIDLSNTVLT